MNIGIDLGTTNSAVAYIDQNNQPQIIHNSEGSRTTPSVILFEDDSVVVGQLAKENAALNPFSVVQFVKRQMGNPHFSYVNDLNQSFTAEELSAIILKKLKLDTEEVLNQSIEGVVITVPAYFNDAQRKSTQDAGKIAGLNVIGTINEPTAAAYAYGIMNEDKNQTIMVYDLGGGTFDVTLMKIMADEVKIISTNGDKNLGGFDFDNKIMEYIAGEFEAQGIDVYEDDEVLQELREKAESAKKILSSKNKTQIALKSQGTLVKLELTQSLLESLYENLFNRTTIIMEMVLEDACLNWSDIDKILLVGGSTRMPMIKKLIYKVTGISPSSELNPDEVVAIGAAHYANSLGNEKSSTGTNEIKITDVNSHSLGIVSNDEYGKPQNTIILNRNTPIPASVSKDFYTAHENQEQIELQITEGEDEDLDYLHIIGTSYLNIKKRPAGSPIRVFMNYDENSIVHVRVVDLVDNEDLGEMKIERTSNLSDADIEKKINSISNIKID